MSTGWNKQLIHKRRAQIINLLGNEYWLELLASNEQETEDYKPTGK